MEPIEPSEVDEVQSEPDGWHKSGELGYLAAGEIGPYRSPLRAASFATDWWRGQVGHQTFTFQLPSPSFRPSILRQAVGNTEEYDKADGLIPPVEHEELQEQSTYEHHQSA